jgi:hypothetical protein
MPITNSEIVLRLSGGSGNTNANASLGGAKSSTAMPSSLFDTVASSEATSGRTEFRCVYVHNANATLTLSNARIWFTTQTTGGRASHSIALGSSPVNGTEQTVGAETTSPTSVTFLSPANFAEGIPLGSIPAGEHRAVWVRRTVPPGAATGSDGFTLSVSGDSPP